MGTEAPVEKDSMQEDSLDFCQSPYIECLQHRYRHSHWDLHLKILPSFFSENIKRENILVTYFRKEISVKEVKITVSSMSTFYRWFSNIHFPRNVCFLKEASTSPSRYLFTIIRMSVRHFSQNSPLKTSSHDVFHNKGVPKKFRRTHRCIYMPASLFQ